MYNKEKNNHYFFMYVLECDFVCAFLAIQGGLGVPSII